MWLGGVTTGLTVGAEGVGTLGVAAGIVGVGVGVGSLLSGGKYDFISSNVNIGWVWPSLVLYPVTKSFSSRIKDSTSVTYKSESSIFEM